MTIKEMKKDKKEVENKINILIDEFQTKYDMEIQDIELSSLVSRSISGKEVYRSIATDIKINL